MLIISSMSGYSQPTINSFNLLNKQVGLYQKAEWNINITADFENPYSANEISVDMILISPLGKEIILPCFFESGNSSQSIWKARFAPRETGLYNYYFKITSQKISETSEKSSFKSEPSNKKGFLHINNLWTFKFDNGELFRGIGENIAWESRSWENEKWTYDYFLPTLSKNRGNFFRVWMSDWNLPLEWKINGDTKRYKSSDEYFHPQGIKRLDEVIESANSLNLYMMIALDHHGALIENSSWVNSNYNSKNGGPAKTPAEFFTLESSKQMYKNRLRYLVARWGYSTNIAAWEFFNEIDITAFDQPDKKIIPPSDITKWHDEMSTYLKGIDPYDHIITTSIAYRDIDGLCSLSNMDLNQRHLYKYTGEIPKMINEYVNKFNKPFVVGEFGYEWDWNADFSKITDGLIFDYKRGLWYGLFNPTPILPMTWWWEFFDEKNMTPYYKSVSEINDKMLAAGRGNFEILPINSGEIESYCVKCEEKIFVYLLNNTEKVLESSIEIKVKNNGESHYQTYTPISRKYSKPLKVKNTKETLLIEKLNLKSKDELVIIISTP